jgi:predicted amidophosphoribosyltransferase
MTSTIKDKPLKKIKADLRITVDSIHSNQINNIKNNINEKDNLNEQIKTLENKINLEKDLNKNIQLQNNLVNLKNKYNKYNSNEHIDYYLDNGLLLSDYYDNTSKFTENNNIKKDDTDKKEKKTILHFFEKNNDDNDNNENININNSDNYDNIINNYMSNINDEYINDFKIDDINICKNCNKKLTLSFVSSEIICDKCGYTEKICANLDGNSYKDPIRESTYFVYKRINHFNEHLSTFQAKETTDIPPHVYESIIKFLKKDKNFRMENITHKILKSALKTLKFNKFYEHIPHIINMITGKQTPFLTRKNEEQLRIMFKDIQTPFQNNCPSDRKNFLSYNYVLHKFCQLLELDHLLIHFSLLKSREKLREQDKIWKNICKDLKWEYIPSI